jgi:ribosomal protein L37AE/L43A
VILTGERLTEQMHGEVVDPREHLARMYPDIAQAIPPLDHVVQTAAPLVARINHGIWVASCECGARGLPRPGCVVFVDRQIGWCARCGNQSTGRGWRPVVVPPEPERRQIEAVLLCRPNVGDRNWEPGETVADLVQQNLDHGDPIPPPDEPPTGEPTLLPTGPRWPTAAGRELLRKMRRRRWLGRG